MKTKAVIDREYADKHNALEVEFFDVINKGKPNQRRALKAGKSIDDFDSGHGEIWRKYDVELVAGGFKEVLVEPEPPRDLEKEIDNLRAEIEKLKK